MNKEIDQCSILYIEQLIPKIELNFNKLSSK